jgi:hypothetical protein
MVVVAGCVFLVVTAVANFAIIAVVELLRVFVSLLDSLVDS